MKQCCDCRAGEHDNYDDDVELTTVRDPNGGRLVKRGYLCEQHRVMYADDGYNLEGQQQ